MAGKKTGPVIPNIVMERLAGRSLADAPVHYGTLGSLADQLGRDMAAHRHEGCFQIHFIEAGALTLSLDGVAFAAQGPVFFFTPPSVTHAFATNDEAHGHVLTLDRALVWQWVDADGSLSRQTLDRPCCRVLVGAEGRHAARGLTRLFRMLRAEAGSQTPGGAAAVLALSQLILVAVLRWAGGEAEESRPRRQEQTLYRRFSDLIEQHFAEHWPVARYGEALAVTEVRLTDLCRRVAGESPKQIVMARLFMEARRLLAFSNLSVNEVANALGFEDVSYFSRIFHKREGVSPSRYRARIQQRGEGEG